jgi:hypothetical protein
MASVTQLLTYLRRESHLIFLPFASALTGHNRPLEGRLVSLGRARSLGGQGVTAATPTNSTAMKDITLVT